MILLALGLALALAVPRIAPFESFVFAFVVPKVLALRAAAILVALGWLWRWTRDRARHAPRWTPITAAFALFVGSAVLSTFVSVDVSRSLWDTQERMLGVVTLVHLLVLYLGVTHGLSRPTHWRALLFAFLGVAVWVSVLAIRQKLDPLLLANLGNPRVASSLGHPTYLAGFGVFQCALGAYLAVRPGHPALRLFAGAAALLGVVSVGLAESRGPMLGLAVGVLVALLSISALAGKGRVRRWSLGVAAAAVACALASLPLLGLERDVQLLEHALTSAPPGAREDLESELAWKRDLYDAAYRVPGIRRFLRASVTKKTADTRLMKWGVAWEAFRDRPLLGYGPNGYAVAYDRFHPPRALLYGADEAWVDDAHNVFLNVLAEQGLLGLVALLLLLGAPVFVVWRDVRRGGGDRALTVVVTGFTAAYLVHLLFVFENPTSWWSSVLWLAYVNARSRTDPARAPLVDELARGAPPKSPRRWLALAGGGALLTASLWPFVVAPARANLRLHHAIARVHDGDVRGATAALDRALEVAGPHALDVRGLFAVAVMELLDEAGRMEQATEEPRRKEAIGRFVQTLKPLALRAFDELGTNLRLDPLVRPALRRAQLALLLAGRFEERETLAVAAANVDLALERAPDRSDLRLIRADLAFALQRPADAIGDLRALLARADDLGPAWWRLVYAQQMSGDAEGAVATLDAAAATGHPFDATSTRNLLALRHRANASPAVPPAEGDTDGGG